MFIMSLYYNIKTCASFLYEKVAHVFIKTELLQILDYILSEFLHIMLIWIPS